MPSRRHAVRSVRAFAPAVGALRDVDQAMLARARQSMDAEAYRRVGGGIELQPMGRRRLYVTIWPAVELWTPAVEFAWGEPGWTEVVGRRPLRSRRPIQRSC